VASGREATSLSKETIQQAIDDFYVWLDGLVAEGKMRTGQRLAGEGRTVFRGPLVSDGCRGVGDKARDQPCRRNRTQD